MIPKPVLERIDEKRKFLNKKRPLSRSVVQKLKEQLAFEMTFNSNAIEGNQLTLKETYLVIQEGITVKGKPLKDHLEAKNHHEALGFLFELVEKDKKHTVSEKLIRSLQHLVIKEMERGEAGKYRQGDVMITGSKHKPPPAYEIPRLMNELIQWIRKNSKKLHPVELASIAHHKLVFIHPFADGNGRTARLFMNLLLMQRGYPLVVILKNDRKKYYRVLEKADKGSTGDLGKFVAQAVERSMNIYLKALETSTHKKDKWVPLSVLSQSSSFSEKYLNLLVRSGKLEAYKEGRIWLSTQKALDDYLKNRQRKRKK
ncbi:MAG: Fic family protein [Proteobacteria bacterium]|nr:Fic family protein [Pseudomonadota bacterium]NDC23901.1 Fic family protein [Pseudomonadota bacterium]NDD04672.1 Fic family protein [Pseudomonadota bacterium]NDG28156.1 Fic family protein [Pseudomonadota bacterium]